MENENNKTSVYGERSVYLLLVINCNHQTILKLVNKYCNLIMFVILIIVFFEKTYYALLLFVTVLEVNIMRQQNLQ